MGVRGKTADIGCSLLVLCMAALAGCRTTPADLDFTQVHSPAGGDPNEFVILGNVQVPPPPASLRAELAVFLGRWEGYDQSPPVKKDTKFVLVIREISESGGNAMLWMGTNLQYPSAVGEIRLDVSAGAEPSVSFNAEINGSWNRLTLAYDKEKNMLESTPASSRVVELDRETSFHVYRDYAQYLAGKRIYARQFPPGLSRYGGQYLLYLPPGYEEEPDRTWPLIMFFHGAGDRGSNPYLIAKASPFMMIREKGPMSFIIAAPLLCDSWGMKEFPDDYLTGALDEILLGYRVDRTRVYATGLSLGGEATYRIALLRPNTFAAISPLEGFLNTIPAMEPIRDLPVWAIHGENDIVVTLARCRAPVEALEKAGGNVRFTDLPAHDHDTWTDTYSDPAFYDWLLQHRRE